MALFFRAKWGLWQPPQGLSVEAKEKFVVSSVRISVKSWALPDVGLKASSMDVVEAVACPPNVVL